MKLSLLTLLVFCLLLCKSGGATGSEHNEQSHKSSCLSGVLEGLLSGAKGRKFGFASTEELPEILKRRWEGAKEISFPMRFQEYFKPGPSSSDIAVLRALSKDGILARPEPPLGFIDKKNVFIEVVEDGPESKTRKVLLNIKGRRYRVTVDRPESQGTLSSTAYRTAGKRHNVWVGAVPWEGTTREEQVWLHSRDALGTSVETSAGKIFTRVEHPVLDKVGSGVCWKDEETGLIWSSPHEESMNYKKAMEYCRSIGAELPTKAMFESLASSKGYHLIPNRNQWFWSSSVNPNYSDHAYAFYGSCGYIIFVFRYNYNDAVVCVGR